MVENYFISAEFLTSLLSNNMNGLQCLASETIWFDKHRYDEAEKCFYEGANGPAAQQQQVEQTHILLKSQKFNFFWKLNCLWSPGAKLGPRTLFNTYKPDYSKKILGDLYIQTPCLLVASFEVSFVSCLTPLQLMLPCQSPAC